MDAVYVDHGDWIEPTELAAGPWDPGLQHGGGPAALLARAIERVEWAADTSHVARLSIDLLRPIPLTPLTVATRVRRSGRKLQFIDATLSTGDTEVARTTALRLRTTCLDLPASTATGMNDGSLPSPGAGAPPPPDIMSSSPFFSGVETRLVRGGFREPGPAAAWFRLRRPIVDGEDPSPLMRVAAVADFANGLSASLDFDRWLYVNADLTISCHRRPEGEWIALDSRMSMWSAGVGCTTTSLYDTDGPFGWSTQSLLVEQRQD